MDKKEILDRVKADDVKFISFQFSDVTGKVKSVDSPVIQLEGQLDNGIWFDGSSVQGFARIQESDMHLRVDTGYLCSITMDACRHAPCPIFLRHHDP